MIDSKTYVRFINAHTYFLDSGVPLGTYVVNFSSNQYFAQNTLSGASADLTWTMAGSPNALTALHLRYDPTYKTYLSVEQHLVGDHEYAIFSVNPATRAEKWWNLALYEKLGSRFQIQSFTQYYTQQEWLREPQASQQTTFINATYALPHSYVTASSQLTNYSLLGPAALVPHDTLAGSLDHPSQLQVTASSFQNKIGNLPLYEQIYEGYGFNHDTVGGNQYLQGFPGYGAPIPTPGLQAYGAPCPDQHGVKNPPVYFCPVYTTIWNTVFGFNLFTPSIKLNQPESPYETYYFNASFNKQYQWNSLPHWISSTNENFSISRQFNRALNTYVGYQILNVGDHYINGGYLPCEPVNTSTCPLSFTSFRGVSTERTTSLGINDAPNPDFNFSLLVRHHDDFPLPVPGLFGLPPNNIIGQPLYTSYLGQAPYDATGRRTLQSSFARHARYFTHLLLVRKSVSHDVLAADVRDPAAADMKRAAFALSALWLAIVLLAASSGNIVVSGQLLAYQDGYVFFTTGDGFHVAQDVLIRDAKNGGPTALHPGPRIWARATFDPSGTRDRARSFARAASRAGKLCRRGTFCRRALLAGSQSGSPSGSGDAAARTSHGGDPTLFGPAGSGDVHRAGAALYAVHVVDLYRDRPKRMERAGHSNGPRRCAALPNHAALQLGHRLPLPLQPRLAADPGDRAERPGAHTAQTHRHRRRRASLTRHRFRVARFCARRTQSSAAADHAHAL